MDFGVDSYKLLAWRIDMLRRARSVGHLIERYLVLAPRKQGSDNDAMGYGGREAYIVV